MTSPEVSVIIPTLGRWELLRQTLSTVARQQDVELEVLVIDGSASGPARSELSGILDERLRVIHLPGSRIAEKRNRGIAEAAGKWIAFLDDDDLWAPWKLTSQLALGKSAGFVFSGCVVVDEHCVERLVLLPPGDDGDLHSKLLAVNVVPAGASNVLARTDAVRALGGFDEEFSILDDWDMWIRLAHEAPVQMSTEIVVAHREHSRSEGITRPRDALVEAERLMEKHGSHEVLDQDRLQRWVTGAHRRANRRLAAATSYLRLARLSRQRRDLARAGAVLLGERAMRLGRRSRPPKTTVHWLSEFRDGSDSER
jgi:hypothetical protein